jgi:hypothetical protein
MCTSTHVAVRIYNDRPDHGASKQYQTDGGYQYAIRGRSWDRLAYDEIPAQSACTSRTSHACALSPVRPAPTLRVRHRMHCV